MGSEASTSAVVAAGDGAEERHRVSVSRLSVFYGTLTAICGVDLNIPHRAITALIGPSGCGKSTFLRTLNRMNDLIPGARTQGTVLLDGQDIYAAGVDVVGLRQRVGMVFQRANPFPMSIWDNIAYGPKIHGVRGRIRLQAIVEHSLKRAGLWDEVKDSLRKSALQLSGGQQQRLCIARALAVEPEVVLLDEPCSALDPASTMRIEELLVDLKRSLTIVMVTHNLSQARRVADMTAFFLNGHLIEARGTRFMFDNPTDARTADYLCGRFG